MRYINLLMTLTLIHNENKAVIEGRLRHLYCHHLKIYFKHTSLFRVAIYAGTLCANMTSSIKPEISNLSIRCQKRTDQRP